jgi:hypothetical protein
MGVWSMGDKRRQASGTKAGLGTEIDQIRRLLYREGRASFQKGMAQLEALGSREAWEELTREILIDGRGRVVQPFWNTKKSPNPGPAGEAVALHLLRGAGRLEEVERLHVTSAFALKALQGLERLESLHVEAVMLPRRLADLRGLPGLRDLHLVNVEIEYLEDLPELPQLTRLSLRGCQLESLYGIERFPGLRVFDLGNCGDRADISYIQGHPALEEIKVSEGLLHWGALSDVPKLSSLEISHVHDWTDADWLGRLEQLEHLRIAFCRTLPDLEALRHWPNLKTLQIVGCGGMENGVEISSLTSAEVLVLSGTEAFFHDFREEGPLYQLWEQGGRVRHVFDPRVKAALAWRDPDWIFNEETEHRAVYLLNLVKLPVRLAGETAGVLPLLGGFSERPSDHHEDFLYVDADNHIVAGFGLGHENQLFTSISVKDEEALIANGDWGLLSTYQHALQTGGDLLRESENLPSWLDLQVALQTAEEEYSEHVELDNGEVLTFEDAMILRKLQRKLERKIEKTLAVFKAMFPDLRYWDLDTGDYDD